MMNLWDEIGDHLSEKAHWILLIIVILLLIIGCCIAFAEEWTPSQIADAIFLAEGGYNATYLYGIRSVHYKDEAEARQICINSIKNNYKRWIKAGKPMGFLEFMSLRYCPVTGENLTEAERRLNQFWVDNVKYFLVKQGREQ